MPTLEISFRNVKVTKHIRPWDSYQETTVVATFLNPRPLEDETDTAHAMQLITQLLLHVCQFVIDF